jgi:hypothetical protein
MPIDRFARVTLLEPLKNADGEFLEKVVLRYGFEQAQRVSGAYWGGANNEYVPMSERMWEDGNGRPPQFRRGNPIDYIMVWDDPEYRSVIVPDYVAHHYFGDWTIPVSQTSNYNEPERTYTAEKRRVATLWGDYTKEPRDRNIANHWRSLRKIAPPQVARVEIQPLDAAQRAIPGQTYNPWRHFMWEKDCVKIPQTAQQRLDAQELHNQGGVFLTPAQIQEMVSAQVAEAMKTAGAGKKAAAA